MNDLIQQAWKYFTAVFPPVAVVFLALFVWGEAKAHFIIQHGRGPTPREREILSPRMK